jgi:hypothetical protein
MITGLSYKECRDVALSLGAFTPEGGMLLEGIAQTFRALGVNARMQPFRSLSDLPDLAVLGVWVTGIGHAVVFKRKKGKGYIFDRNQKVPLSPERFTFMEHQCVAIPKVNRPRRHTRELYCPPSHRKVSGKIINAGSAELTD